MKELLEINTNDLHKNIIEEVEEKVLYPIQWTRSQQDE